MAINIKSRSDLASKIRDLYLGAISWGMFDEFIKSMEDVDSAAFEVAQFIWEIANPEFPENKKHLTDDLVNRVVLFLHSELTAAARPYSGEKRLTISLWPPRIYHVRGEANHYWPFSNKAQYLAQTERKSSDLDL